MQSAKVLLLQSAKIAHLKSAKVAHLKSAKVAHFKSAKVAHFKCAKDAKCKICKMPKMQSAKDAKKTVHCDDVKPAITSMAEFLLVDRAIRQFEESSGCKMTGIQQLGSVSFLLLGDGGGH